MNLLNRGLAPYIEKDLNNGKMVFIGGPRQVGKSTLAISFLENPTFENPHYFNWDNALHRKKALAMEFPNQEEYLIFDEIHKYKAWSNFVKGVFDTYRQRYKIIVTGSARLDYYTKGGDSLVGRYHYYRLHPYSIYEWQHFKPDLSFDDLWQFGGFPEPLLERDHDEHRRWQNQRLRNVVRDDLRDLERVKEISQIDLLIDALPSRICSPLSFNALAEDLSVSPKTVTRWVDILEKLYVCFAVSPLAATKIRSVKKEKKYYLWDYSQIEDVGARFENFVACQLLMYCHFLEETKGYRMSLNYLRDTDKREVDFVVSKDNRPLFAVECKYAGRKLNPNILYFKERMNLARCYQVHFDGEDFGDATAKGRVLSLEKFCQVERPY